MIGLSNPLAIIANLTDYSLVTFNINPASMTKIIYFLFPLALIQEPFSEYLSAYYVPFFGHCYAKY